MIDVELVAYDPSWHEVYRGLETRVARALGPRAVAIDHIGSTSIQGIAAKPIIDIQVTVPDLALFDDLRQAIESVGYRFWPDNDDRRKRYFTLDDAKRRISNLHMRQHGEFSAAAALLFRDYLRANPEARNRYEATKRRLAAERWPTIDHYADAKGDTIWALLREADVWAQEQ